MNDTLCHVQTQYYENYGDAQNPHWKAKGGFLFKLMVDSDDFAYQPDECILALKKCLQEASDDHQRFEYIEHELIFSKPIELKGFEENLNLMLDIKYSEQ
jgi:hypothetical protein